MATITPYNDKYRQWGEIDFAVNPFDSWSDTLDAIGLTVDDAFNYFTLDYYGASTNYTDSYIIAIFLQVLKTAGDKYTRMIAAAKAEYNPIHNVDATETYTDVRTPDLQKELTLNTTSAMTDTRSSTLTLNTTTSSSINQTRTTTDTPNNLKSTNVHSVNPYDNPGYYEESKDETTQTGSTQQTESYTGNPDTTQNTGTNTTQNSGGTSTTNTGTNTETDTGTETVEHNARRYGNIGVTSSQNLVGQELDLAERLNIFKVIEQDIAAKLFLQVWI